MKFAKSNGDGTKPTSGWVKKAKSTRLTGSEKAFSDQLKQTVEKLEKVMEEALDEDTRSEQQKTEDANLLKACKEVYNTPSFRRCHRLEPADEPAPSP